MTPDERDALVEQAASAHRGRDLRDGHILPSPAWLDLEAADRERAFAVAIDARALEAALDPDGLSTTARAVLARIERR